MPIYGMTDQKEEFATIGDIRKGAAKTANRPGEDLDYFRVEFLEGETDAIAAWKDLGKKEPKELSILFPFNEIDRCWDAFLEAYQAGALLARSDGEKFLYLRNHKTDEVIVNNGIEIATGKIRKYHDGEVVHSYKKNKKTIEVTCKPVGRLKVLLPELVRLAPLTVHTTSIHDIKNISSQLRALKKINDGELRGIPILLKRRPRKVSTPGEGGKRVRRKIWLISLEADPIWVREKLSAMKLAALPGNGTNLLPEHTPEEIIEAELVSEGGPENDPNAPVIRFTTVTLEKAVNANLAPDIEAAGDWLESSNLPLGAKWDKIERWLNAFNRGLENNNDREDLAATAANIAYDKAEAK